MSKHKYQSNAEKRFLSSYTPETFSNLPLKQWEYVATPSTHQKNSPTEIYPAEHHITKSLYIKNKCGDAIRNLQDGINNLTAGYLSEKSR